MKRTILLSCVVLLVSAGVTFAQGPGRGGDLPRNTFDLGARAEWWEAEAEITGSNTGVPDSDLNDNMDWWAQHTSGMITGDYRHNAPHFTFIAHAGLGLESIATTMEDSWGDAFWCKFDNSFVWELGAAGRGHFGRADAGLSVLFRSGEAEVDEDAFTTYEYEYTMLRISGEFGVEVAPGARPFAGLRYTMYKSEFREVDGVEFEYEMDQPVGLFLGIELGTVGPVGRIEIMFVDVDFGMFASAGWRF